MPHPERVFRTVQMSWHPDGWTSDESPWLRLFRNARVRVGLTRTPAAAEGVRKCSGPGV